MTSAGPQGTPGQAWERNLVTHLVGQRLLEDGPDGQTAAVEVLQELGVHCAPKLGHLLVGGGDKDSLHRLQGKVVEESILGARSQPKMEETEGGRLAAIVHWGGHLSCMQPTRV